MESKSSWQLRAKCRGVDLPDEFFSSSTKFGKTVCKECPVMDLCRTYAIAHDEYGIWGGLSRYERLRLGDVYRDFIRLMYYQNGLLEYRVSLEDFVERQEEQRQVQSFPIVQLVVS